MKPMPSCEARVGEVQAAQRTGQDLREYRPAGVFWHDVKAFRSGVGVLLTALMIPPVIARIHAEERLLRTEFVRCLPRPDTTAHSQALLAVQASSPCPAPVGGSGTALATRRTN